MEIFRQIRDKFFPQREDRSAQYRAEELDYARELIRYMFISGQTNLSEMSNSLRAARRGSTELAREIINRLSFDVEQRSERFSDRLAEEVAIGRIFQTVGATPAEQDEIHLQALQGAKDYWENRLAQPDLIANEIMLGRRRLTQISAKLEELEKGQGPQVP